MSLEDGAATLTKFTGDIICSELNLEIQKVRCKEILLCGGGRKNKALVKKINKNISKQVVFKSIDEYGINGDFIESQAFAFLAIRTILKLPITFPNTTGCQKPCLGGKIIGLD